MSHIVLVLNAVILVVNFFLSYASSTSQIGLLESSSRTADTGRSFAGLQADDVEFLRLTQSLSGVLPAGRAAKLTKDELLAVRTAMRIYRQATTSAVRTALDGDGTLAGKPELDLVGRRVRSEIEQELGQTFRDDVLVRQLTTAVIRFG